MPSTARHRSGHLSVAAFRAWRASRPDEERWELIDGVPMMMTPPTLAHQRIASNLERLLNDALEAARLPFEAYQRAGLNLANVEYYDSEPDVVVVDRPQRPDQRYCDRFRVAAEVVSPSDDPIIDAKCQLYRDHPHCSCVLIVRQGRCEVVQQVRVGETWASAVLARTEDELVIEACALRCRVGDLYRGVVGLSD